jgi:hypothetical protein
MKLVGVVGPLIALAACTQQKLTQSQCVVGYASGFVGTTGNEEHITVAENGSPCVIDVARQNRGSGSSGLGGQIKIPPAHGTASIRDTGYVTQIVYAPAPNFVGSDKFMVVFGPDFNATVFVDVVPVTNTSTAPR